MTTIKRRSVRIIKSDCQVEISSDYAKDDISDLVKEADCLAKKHSNHKPDYVG